MADLIRAHALAEQRRRPHTTALLLDGKEKVPSYLDPVGCRPPLQVLIRSWTGSRSA
jgi:hypothetical protein